MSVNYVIAHEYGHHIAAPPLQRAAGGAGLRAQALVLVRARVQEHRWTGASRPGSQQGNDYLSNPGEAWAEAYARLVFPTEAWRFTSLLKPTQGSTLAAQADVLQPWSQRVAETFKGTGTRSFKLPITLDGAFTLKLDGPSRTNYDIVVKSGGKVVDRTTKRGSSDRIHYRIACRDRRTENLRISVVRRSGAPGPFTLAAKYAG